MLKYIFFPFIIYSTCLPATQDQVVVTVQDAKVSCSSDSFMTQWLDVKVSNELQKAIKVSRYTVTYYQTHRYPGNISIEILSEPNVCGPNYDQINICGVVVDYQVLPGQSIDLRTLVVLMGNKPGRIYKARLHLTIGSEDEDQKLWRTYSSNIFSITTTD